MTLIKIFILCILFLCSCESRIEFLVEQDPEEECLSKEVNGELVCVEQKTETFHINNLGNKNVDFLFVLDVSRSMTEDLTRLGQAFRPLISQISDTNWRMFFTTADHGDHNYLSFGEEKQFSEQKWEDYKGEEPYFGQFMYLEYQGKKLNQQELSPAVSDYENVFKDTLTRLSGDGCSLAPYCQGDMEQPLRVLNSVLERWAKTGGPAPVSATEKTRKRDTIVSFIVTDEDERSEDPKSAFRASKVVENFKKWFPKKSFHSFALVVQDEACLEVQKKHSSDSVYGTRVSELAPLTQGKNISICEKNYGPALEGLSHLLRNLIQDLQLEEEPLVKEEVTVDFVKGANQGWELKGKKLFFKEALQTGSEIQVSYFVKPKGKP